MMVKKQSRKGNRNVPKSVLRLPDLDQAKSAVLNSLSSVDVQRGSGTQLTNSSSGTARSLDYRSARPLSSRIAYTWNLANWRPVRSTFGSARCADWRTRLAAAACSARTWRPVSDA